MGWRGGGSIVDKYMKGGCRKGGRRGRAPWYLDLFGDFLDSIRFDRFGELREWGEKVRHGWWEPG